LCIRKLVNNTQARGLHSPGEFEWGKLKEAHSLWMQTGAELGFVGVGFLAAFYGLCILKLAPLIASSSTAVDPASADLARMVIASLSGFAMASQFVSLEGLELPYYVTLIGVGALALNSRSATNAGAAPGWQPVLSPFPTA
jgi:hypothetical protein